MIKAIDVESGKYCHYQGCGRWILNQIYGEPKPDPEKEIFVRSYSDSGDPDGEEVIIIEKRDDNSRISINGHVIMSEIHIADNVDIFDRHAHKLGLRINRDSNFTLEILDTSAEPPISRQIKIERFSFPGWGSFLKWPEFDKVFRRQIAQEEIS